MEVEVSVDAEHLRTQEKRHTTSCFFTMVAIDEQGKSFEVPSLLLETDAEIKRYKEAEQRKTLRQASLNKEHKHTIKSSEGKF